MDISRHLGYSDVLWTTKAAADDDDAYIEMIAFDGDPKMHTTQIVRVHPSFVDKYGETMRAYTAERVRSKEPYILTIKMCEGTYDDLGAHVDFIRHVGRIHEELHETHAEYTTYLKRALIVVPNSFVAQTLNITINTLFKPLVKLEILSVDEVVRDPRCWNRSMGERYAISGGCPGAAGRHRPLASQHVPDRGIGR